MPRRMFNTSAGTANGNPQRPAAHLILQSIRLAGRRRARHPDIQWRVPTAARLQCSSLPFFAEVYCVQMAATQQVAGPLKRVQHTGMKVLRRRERR